LWQNSSKSINETTNLIVEILSPSNASYDRETKFDLYQEAGVAEYWLVDYEAKTVEVFTLTEGEYLLKGKYFEGEVAVSTQLAEFEIAVKTIFDF
jgi:Uma2 family endonuclease